jgi:UDP-N-acetylglucosamine--N-acetylmuramyl-(pentapeptide) pyrophosphoryl-undecaprenol N-acetylglucosamine transferase
MDLAYAASDFIISRAGALSVSELCLVGKPVIFIPSPNVSEDHQTKNAQSISAKGAAVLIAEKDLDRQFEDEFYRLFNSEEIQLQLSKNCKALGKPNATKEIVEEIEKLLKEAKD